MGAMVADHVRCRVTRSSSHTPMRAAPFASAASRRTLNDGATVEMLRNYAGWVLVRRGTDQGWLQKSEIVPLIATR